MQSPYKLASLTRGLSVLALFTREQPTLSLSEIITSTGLSKSTAFRIAITLKDLGYLERSRENKRFSPGPKVLNLGFTALSSLELRRVARPITERLAHQVGYTVSLAILDGMDVVYIDLVQPSAALGVNLDLGMRIPAHATSLGKAIMAFLPQQELDCRLHGAQLERCTPYTIADHASLQSNLEIVRELGYSCNDEEWVLGLRSTGAPILNARGEAVASINCAVPADMVSRIKLESDISPKVSRAALNISQALDVNSRC